jgi:hypothetical protein
MENQSWFLAHNAPAHQSDLVTDNVTTLQHPQFSSDLAEADFLPVPSTEISIEGTTPLLCY